MQLKYVRFIAHLKGEQYGVSINNSISSELDSAEIRDLWNKLHGQTNSKSEIKV